MSAFTHGFNHGFFAGLINKMTCGFGMFNFDCWNSAPTFFTPSYNFGNFFQYQSPITSMPTIWASNIPNFQNIQPDWNNTTFSNTSANLQPYVYNSNSNWQMSNFTSTFNWNDTFEKTTPNKSNKTKQETTLNKNNAKSLHWTKMSDSQMKEVYGNYTKDITKLYTGTADDLNKYLKDKGKLKDTGKAFIDAQKKYGISASVLVAICLNESGKGTSNLAKTKNNIGGVRIKNSAEFRTFSSVEECIDYMGSFLKSGYVNQSLTKLYQINAKYCPASDITDKAGNNSRWAKAVDMYSKQVEAATA